MWGLIRACRTNLPSCFTSQCAQGRVCTVGGDVCVWVCLCVDVCAGYMGGFCAICAGVCGRVCIVAANVVHCTYDIAYGAWMGRRCAHNSAYGIAHFLAQAQPNIAHRFCCRIGQNSVAESCGTLPLLRMLTCWILLLRFNSEACCLVRHAGVDCR